MSISRTSGRSAALAVALSLFAAQANTNTFAQPYPSKPVRLVVGFPAGGPADFVARTIGQALSKPLGQAVIIENKPGADTAIAAQTVLSAPADGYTLLYAGAVMVPLSLVKSPAPFDMLTDFAPVSTISRFAWAMYVAPAVPARSVAEFVEYARANPGKLSYASSNLGEFLAAAQFMKATGTNLVRVPYKGAAQAMPDLMTGRVQMNFSPIGAGLAHAKEGRVRMLAVLQPERSSAMPEVSTMTEAGVAGMSVPAWNAIMAPAKTPKDVIHRLSVEIGAALRDPEVRAQLERRATQADASTPEALAAILREDTKIWRQFIIENRLAPE